MRYTHVEITRNPSIIVGVLQHVYSNACNFSYQTRCLFIHCHDNVIYLSLSSTHCTQLAEGVGQLLFEVCKGVTNQFHSCTEKLFPLLLSQLGSPHYSSSSGVFQTLTKLVQLMAEHMRAQFSTPVWTPLLVSSCVVITCMGSLQH